MGARVYRGNLSATIQTVLVVNGDTPATCGRFAAMSQVQRPSQLTLLLAGLLALGAGGAVVALGAGWINSPPGYLHAPRWVVVTAGLLFVLAGLSMLGPRDERSLVAAVFGALLTSLFAIVGSWVAFGSGQRHFGGALGTGFGRATTTVNEWSGRIVFGFGAVVLLLMAGWAWWRCYRLLQGRRRA